ncbi:MAG: PspA/IM30 family protein [Spirochaetales bacterium]|nr:PspA/IM30 family protein [Spirochaetales bacterium]
MSIFTRFKDIVNSNINSLLDKAEDPEKMLRLMIGEMEDTVIDLKTTTAARMAEAIRSEKKVDEAKATVERWQARAELAIEKGKDDLAREALIEKKHAQEVYERALENISSLKKSVEEGKEEIRTLEDKIKAAKDKLATLQREQARAQERRDSSINLNARFEEMENRINRMNAYNDLSKKSEEKSAEEKFTEMEKNDEIEAEIERIKKEKGIEK